MVLLSPESDQPIDLFKPKTEARFDLYVDPKLSLLNDHPKMFEINLIPINFSSIIQPFYLINYSSLYDLSDGFS